MAHLVRRSELICPGSNPKMMAKAAASVADEVIFDLEDAVTASEKDSARKLVTRALRTLDFTGGKLRAYRVNAPRSPWFVRDLTQVLEGAGRFVDSLVIPKVERVEDVTLAAALIDDAERQGSLGPQHLGLELMIESPLGLLRALELATASPRVTSLIFGVADYAASTRARDFREGGEVLFAYPRAHLLAVARAAGVQVIDSVTVQYSNLEQVRADARASARLGFDGKWAIHPAQLAPIHEAYTPTAQELARAKRIVAAYKKSKKVGAIVIDGDMVDQATVELELNTLEVARRAGLTR